MNDNNLEQLDNEIQKLMKKSSALQNKIKKENITIDTDIETIKKRFKAVDEIANELSNKIEKASKIMLEEMNELEHEIKSAP
ncbi:hypothetical protein DCO58_10925 [Helicobacter saguini]|uniref:Uncharacterized protein n=1 Tax=Helicobacter saguini TaxID=1548018 RepID=A0A347VPW0_9HELI|nr:hypothetical protein [Helicobacter saguini]MWV61189.1 hypothetical protein [Helicobacter saguini]MWV68144.1 hypothetical protein [Helicobacter saguini]MWV70393.1 hypothetical protein [Helicobacter saguini]MWV72294.1 hypothetical protein [Helicobacter saguini]TLD95333.1 hypothetical protein LS64_003050 [Helicobacter saguini]